MNDSPIKIKSNMVVILILIVAFALVVQITRSQYVLRFNSNQEQVKSVQSWKQDAEAPNPPIASASLPFCLMYDGTDEASTKMMDQAAHVLSYMKRPSAAFDIRQAPLQPEGCTAILISFQQMNLLGDPDKIAEYVRNGGYVFQLIQPEEDAAFYRLYRKMGILNSGQISPSKGVKLEQNVLIGEKDLLIADEFIINTVMDVELDPNSRLLMSTAEGVPLMWDHVYGKGKFMVFNGTMLQEKINRGLIAGGISLLLPDFIYPIFDAKVMYIDDFPAPIGQTVDAAIYKEFRLDRPAFFKQIWWPDMLKTAKRHTIKYTAVLIESYNDKVTPPFEAPNDADEEGLISFGREVIKSGGEIGLHGYNHQSLVLDQAVSDEFGYQAWANTNDMQNSIQEAIQFTKRSFPSYTMLGYVPPSNVLSSEGRQTIKQAWPELAVISSLYAEDITGLSYVQEFELAKDGVLEMPRITSGYFEQAFERWAEASTMTTLGFYSHFIHPDDLLSPERSNNMNWEQLLEEYDHLLARVEKTYPWLTPKTSTEAAIGVKRTLQAQVEWEQDSGKITGRVHDFENELSFVLRSDKKIGSLSGCTVKKIDAGTYLVVASKANFTIELSEA
ncbi:DUF2194 domain-containing protein [Paenibacillus methanolicus]|uniref:DUF2194 domain-containing protein n=1 Tax=Paenibacillus methanolicus TaxID=582686 RepID=A0A5S5BN73_9BACL|nr:DUF2194 domain-containing protein [Paenibacillus methanolicus]TYP68635.1 hypothetical protein BCM02_11832 [Paenibacillus methanolicus]